MASKGRSSKASPVPSLNWYPERIHDIDKCWSSFRKLEKSFRSSKNARNNRYACLNKLIRILGSETVTEEHLRAFSLDDHDHIFSNLLLESFVSNMRTFVAAVRYQVAWLQRWRSRNRHPKDPQAAKIFDLHTSDPKQWSWSKLGKEFGIARDYARTKFRRFEEWQESQKDLEQTQALLVGLEALLARMKRDVDSLKCP